MYPNYPYDDARTQAIDIGARAIEGDIYHTLMQSGSVTISATANTLSTASVTFTRPYTTSKIPDVVYGLKTVGNTASVIKFTDISAISETGFTLRVMTDTTQSLVYTWIAKGSAD